jgi:hypothetical protein
LKLSDTQQRLKVEGLAGFKVNVKPNGKLAGGITTSVEGKRKIDTLLKRLRERPELQQPIAEYLGWQKN